MPSFDNLLALDPEDFSDDVKAAASFVAQLCINSTDKSVLNVFGRPTAIKVLSPNILIVGYRIGQVNELDFEIGDGKVLRISEASVYSNIRIGNHEISRDVRNRQLLAYYAERVRKNDIVKYRELSNDMQISIRKVLGYVTQKTPIDADDKQNLVTVCSLFKGEASSRVLEVFGAPTAITGTKDEGKLHGYTLDYSAGIRFFFNIEGSLDRTEVR